MIQVGQKVYSGLYGGRYGVVYAIHGEQRPETIHSLGGGVVICGGNAEFDIVFTNGTETQRLPEGILYGVQWKIRDEVVGAEEIKDMRDFAATETARKQAENEEKARTFKAAVDSLRADPEYASLQQTGQGVGVYSSKLAALNIRRQLKSAFPGVKFSVKTFHHSQVQITWTDGPTRKHVAEIAERYAGGFFDGMNDIYEHRDSPWTTVFGSAQYVNMSRRHSVEAMKQAVEAVAARLGYPSLEVLTSYDGTGYTTGGDFHHNQAIGDCFEQQRQFVPASL